VPAFLNIAVMLTNVGRGWSPPAGNTKCQRTAPFPLQSLVAFMVLALPGIGVGVVASASVTARGMLASTTAAAPTIEARAPAAKIEPANKRHLRFIRTTSCA
jgi:hypothetical protein